MRSWPCCGSGTASRRRRPPPTSTSSSRRAPNGTCSSREDHPPDPHQPAGGVVDSELGAPGAPRPRPRRPAGAHPAPAPAPGRCLRRRAGLPAAHARDLPGAGHRHPGVVAGPGAPARHRGGREQGRRRLRRARLARRGRDHRGGWLPGDPAYPGPGRLRPMTTPGRSRTGVASSAIVESGRMRPLELASGTVRGMDAEPPVFPAVEPLSSTRAAFEQVVLAALQTPPCVVSFSGGRDSSAVLAVAAHVARREGLPLPVPVTLRFPDDPATQEDDWQELVLRHLGIDDRVTLSFTDELDVLGPYARETLRTLGPIWPANAHIHVAIAEQARGGCVLTGFGGDDLLTPDPLFRRVNRVLAREVRPEARDALRLAVFAGPNALRREAMRRHFRGVPPR